jgi:acetyl-CoA synthetase
MPLIDHDPDLNAWLEAVTSFGPETPFGTQWETWSRLSATRPNDRGPLPAWQPDPQRLTESNIATFMADRGLASFDELHRWSVDHRADFWGAVIDRLGIAMVQPATTILDLESGPAHPRWLPGARLNIADSCFAPSDCTLAAVIGREGSDEIETITYGELESLANRFAAGLTARGLAPGRGIALYMPMNLECVAAYLGVVRAGSFVISIADSFSAEEVARRLRIADAAAIVTVDRFRRAGRDLELYAKVRDAGAPTAIVLPAGTTDQAALRDGDLWWHDLLEGDGEFATVAQDPTAVTNVLFSSGTTGDPKAIPWTHLTPIKAAMDGHFHHDIRPGDVVAWPTNIGWMMGPWLIYASLVNRACIALYEGSPGTADFCRFVGRTGVTMLGVVPSLVRAWRESGACDGCDWSGIRVFSSTGEPSNRRDYLWLMSRAGYRAPVIEYCGGTEIGGGHLTGSVLQPQSPAAFSTPALGLDLMILDDQGHAVAENGEGEVFLVPPSIGLSQVLLNRDHDEIYYQGCPPGPNGEVLRRHGDQVARLPRGYFRAHGRADDTMNLGGIKVSSRELEVVLDSHPAVYEAAAVAIQPDGEGADRLVVFAVLKNRSDPTDLRAELQRAISEHLNPLFRIHDLVIVESLPRTASNKLMRRRLRADFTANTDEEQADNGPA